MADLIDRFRPSIGVARPGDARGYDGSFVPALEVDADPWVDSYQGLAPGTCQ